MAIKADLVPTLRTMLGPVPPGGRIMTFGRQTVQHPDFADQESLFRALGFAEVHSLDTSAYEGCTHLHDLNDPKPPAELAGRYRVVFTGGTLEHVFEFTNALRTAIALIEPGGWFVHLGPMNGWVDHGFYQFSPTLFFDWLTANGFELHHSLARLPDGAGARSAVVPLHPGEGIGLSAVRGRLVHLLSARKLAASSSDRTPLQSLYASQYGPGRSRYRFRAIAPFIAADPSQPVALHRFPLAGFAPWREGGHSALFHRDDILPSAQKRPFRSKALVYEDGRLLDWVVSAPDIVAERHGSFTHFGRRVHLTASDGSDPRSNGRSYEVAFPAQDILMPKATKP